MAERLTRALCTFILMPSVSNWVRQHPLTMQMEKCMCCEVACQSKVNELRWQPMRVRVDMWFWASRFLVLKRLVCRRIWLERTALISRTVHRTQIPLPRACLSTRGYGRIYIQAPGRLLCSICPAVISSLCERLLLLRTTFPMTHHDHKGTLRLITCWEGAKEAGGLPWLTFLDWLIPIWFCLLYPGLGCGHPVGCLLGCLTGSTNNS